MAKAVFIQNEGSIYEDAPGQHYHFPNHYLSRVAQTVGDWVIFYASRAGGGRGYYSVQRVSGITPDPRKSDHSFAWLDEATEWSFEKPVARRREDGRPFETGLPASGGSNASAVRLISESDFAAIIAEGLTSIADADSLPRSPDLTAPPGMAEPLVPFLTEPRPVILTSRAARDASFERQVKRAYGGRCAMSGLALRNGGGRPEVQAAHIRSVAGAGPDTVRNGLALSGTLHWMFDRGLVSVDDDHTILIAKGSYAEAEANRLLRPERRLHVPAAAHLQPHPAYLRWHREHVFKG